MHAPLLELRFDEPDRGDPANADVRSPRRVAIRASDPPAAANPRTVFSDTLGSALRAGDETVFTALITEVVPALIRYAAVRTGNHADAEEIVQDVFVRLWAGRQQLPNRITRGYLFRAVRNALLDIASHQRVAESYATHAKSDPIATADPKVALDTTLTIEYLLTRLPERRRQAIELRYWGGLSHAEIGEALGISAANAERLVARSVAALQQIADEWGRDSVR